MASLIDNNNCLPEDRMLWKVSLSGDVRSKVFFCGNANFMGLSPFPKWKNNK